MRLFVGVEIEEVVANQLATFSNELRSRAARMAPGARITWVPAERLHVTVRFIGNADDALTRAIETTLEEPIPVPPFDAAVEGLGAFPMRGPLKVLWAGIRSGGAELQAVERDVSRRLDRAGTPSEKRAYTPHITMARIREAAGLRSSALFEGLDDAKAGIMRVDAVTLFESRLSPKGPTYTVVQRTPLGG